MGKLGLKRGLKVTVMLNKRRYQSSSSLSSREIAVFDMSTAILHNTFKTTTPLIDATVNETLPLGDYRSLQFFHRVKFSSVIDSLLKGTTNSIIHWIKIRAFCWPHVKLDEVDVLFFRWASCAGARSCWSVRLWMWWRHCPDVRQHAPFQDDLTVVAY